MGVLYRRPTAQGPVQHTVNAVIRSGEQSGYAAECVELPVVTQGATLDEIVESLREAIALQLEGEDPGDFGLTHPITIVVTLEVSPVAGAA